MTSTSVPFRRMGSAAAAATLGAAALLGGWATAAGAHGGEAEIAVATTEDVPEGVRVVVEVTSADDGHPAPDAVVTATAQGPDGASTGPVTLEAGDEEGLYDGVVELAAPGEWTVTFASLEPDGTLDYTHNAEESGDATEAEGEGAGADEAEEDEAAGDDGPDTPDSGDDGQADRTEPTVVSPDADPEVLSVDEAEDDDPSVVLLVLVFVVLAAVVAGAFWLIMSRRQASTSTPTSSAAKSDAEAKSDAAKSGEADGDGASSDEGADE